MRKILILVFVHAALHAGVFSHVPRQFRQAVEAIEELPEAQPLLRRVEAEGKVRLQAGNGAFEGFWEGGSARTITVVSRQSLGAVIGTILFELHNAASEGAMQGLINEAAVGNLDREGYVEGVERLEYQTGIRTSELIERGIERGLFPLDTRMVVLPSFEEHYRYQQWAGHSDWIAAHFDWMFAG